MDPSSAPENRRNTQVLSHLVQVPAWIGTGVVVPHAQQVQGPQLSAGEVKGVH